ncbi:MAG: SdpI family protein [Eubacterium sp.]|nr:SdpI family protein [Eubacterium sp.]
MVFWIFMFLMNMIIPLMMIAFGKIFLKNPPKEINSVYGYRTSMSMKNRDTWDFAHQYCGKLWYRLGLAMLPISAAVMCFAIGKDETITGMVGGIVCAVQTIALIASVCPTERALKKKFGNG